MTAALESPPARPDAAPEALPVLQPGDSLTRDEFERRYHRMRSVKKAELIEGIVYMPSPVRAKKHARPHSRLNILVGFYETETPGVELYNNSTVRLDLDNEPQPDLCLIIAPESGGQTRFSPDDYIEGAPELCIEIAASTAAYDMHQKKRAYRRNGVREYLVWLTEDRRFVLWELKEGDYCEIAPDTGGILKSRVFPGLWFDSEALLAGNLKQALAVLQHGLASGDHASFSTALAARG